jgi:diguanylate cyclase (GGDEF)-like protein/PAS domain S-box-containing protein
MTARRYPRPETTAGALVYALAGTSFILASDLVLGAFAGEVDHFETLLTGPAVLYSGITTLILWLLIRGWGRKVRATNQAVIETESRLRMALTAAGGALWQADFLPSGKVMFQAAGGLARDLGLAEGTVIPITALRDLVHLQDRPDFDKQMHWLRDKPDVLPDFICRFRTAPGVYRWVKLMPDFDSKARSGGTAMIGLAFDITELQDAAKTLQEVVAGAELGTWRFNLQTGINQVNDRWTALLGYTRADLEPITVERWTTLVHPEDRARIDASLAKGVSQGNYFFADELRMRHKDGHWVWIMSRGRILERDQAGEPMVLSGVHIDISRRKALEMELQTERDFLMRLTETSVSGILALSEAGKLVFANAEAERILGLSDTDMLGRPHDDANWQARNLDGTEIKPEEFPFATVMRTGEVVRDFRMRFTRPDGAERVLSVNVAPLHLRDGVVQAVGVITDITDRLTNEGRLAQTAADTRYAALHDHMTGLPNRELFEDYLEAAIARCRQSGGLLMQVYIDIDNFKQVNDRFGRRLGDNLICKVAKRLQEGCTEGHFLARVAGDEFACLHPMTEESQTAGILSRLNAVFATSFDLQGQSVYLSASMGISLFPMDAAGNDEIWLNSDIAMHEAKAQGKNQAVQFSAALRDRLATETHVAQALRRAIERRSFTLELQPKVNLAEPGVVIGAEALLRCHDPELQGVSPGEFIPMAAKAGLIRNIDLMVIDLLGEVLAELRGKGMAFPISVNLSPDSLRHSDFSVALMAHLAAAEIEPGDIILELTEGAMIDMNSNARDTVERLVARGYELSADDFGTGYSSLSYLHQLHLRELKIDRSFVARLGRDGAGSEPVVQAILALADALGIRTVAEGIETRAQLDWLVNHGCAQGQGYLLGKAVPPAEFAAKYALTLAVSLGE